MRQIALPIDALRPDAQGSLIITDSNMTIVQALAERANWPGRCAILTGPARSGKSLMARYFVGAGVGEVVDDAEIAGDEKLFNAWNRAQQDEGALLLISRFVPAKWNIALPDLKSRLASALHLEISSPDDELVNHLLQKHLQDRGTAVTPEVMAYVTKRIERRYSALEDFARDINARALSENRAVGLSLAKQILVD
ncbi:MAG: DnaA/Hda family protein [Sphingorhabdus sp.]